MDIRILPSNIANMIAAGEVVQRPASVVKELMENSLDAGATKVSLVVEDAGRTLMQVIDNGCGMTPDQAVLCFERHATSKIATAEDLQAIETFGFRGEALASIAAVAEVNMKTRTEGQELGTMVTISDATANDPGKQDVTEVAAPVGTNFRIRNLFYNTPARRKFLKSDATELKMIISEFNKLALSRTDVAFNMTSDGREIYHLAPATTLKFRIQDLLGKSVADDLMPVQTETTICTVSGFVGRPDHARKSGANQYFFVNGRYFRSPYLHKAVMTAYDNLLPDGAQPSYFIYLEVDPHSMDINVHPTKTEIKFEDDNVLFNVLMAAVRQSLGRVAIADELDFDNDGLPQLRQIGESVGEYKGITEPPVAGEDFFNPFDGDGFPNQQQWEAHTPAAGSMQGSFSYPGGASGSFSGQASQAGSSQGGSSASWYAQKPSLGSQDMSALFDAMSPTGEQGNPATPARPQPMVCGKYILLPTQSGVMLVDGVRAMQRILYERFLSALSCESPVSQATLFPVEVEIGAEQMPVIQENSELLHSLGFDFSQFSPTTITVNGLPEGLTDDRMSVSALVYEVICSLSDEQASLAGAMYSSLAEKLSKSAASRAEIPTDPAGARLLTDRLFACDNSEFTSDGRPTVTMLRSADFEKLMK